MYIRKFLYHIKKRIFESGDSLEAAVAGERVGALILRTEKVMKNIFSKDSTCIES